MKKLLILVCILFLVGCAPKPDEAQMDPPASDSQAAETESQIADLEAQVQDLTVALDSLQSDYADLQDASASYEMMTDGFMCDPNLENMRYQNPVSAIAILEGWFAQQPQVQELQGTYSTQFWTGLKSRIHTIRYLTAESGETETATFLLFFEEENWQEGLLSMSDQCWLDFPE